MTNIITEFLGLISVVMQFILWFYVAGPVLVVVSAFQLSYEKVTLSYAKTFWEKTGSYLRTAFWWFLILSWIAGLVGLFIYNIHR